MVSLEFTRPVRATVAVPKKQVAVSVKLAAFAALTVPLRLKELLPSTIVPVTEPPDWLSAPVPLDVPLPTVDVSVNVHVPATFGVELPQPKSSTASNK